MIFELRPSKIEENTENVHLELLMQDVARLNIDCPSHWKIPSLFSIISDLF